MIWWDVANEITPCSWIFLCIYDFIYKLLDLKPMIFVNFLIDKFVHDISGSPSNQQKYSDVHILKLFNLTCFSAYPSGHENENSAFIILLTIQYNNLPS